MINIKNRENTRPGLCRILLQVLAGGLLVACPPFIPDVDDPYRVRIEVSASENVVSGHVYVSVTKDGARVFPGDSGSSPGAVDTLPWEIELDVDECGCLVAVNIEAPATVDGTELRDILITDETGVFRGSFLLDEDIDEAVNDSQSDFTEEVQSALDGASASGLSLHVSNMTDDIERRVESFDSATSLELSDDLHPTDVRSYTAIDWKRFKHSGTTTDAQPNRLIDDSAGTAFNGVRAGSIAYTADGAESALVTAEYDASSPGVLELDSDIFSAGEEYVVYLDYSATLTGTTSDDEENLLIDAGAGFSAEKIRSGYAIVENITADAVARVTAVVDADTLELDRDIFSTGDQYRICNEVLISRDAYATEYSVGRIVDSNAEFSKELNLDCYIVNSGSGVGEGNIGRLDSIELDTSISVIPVSVVEPTTEIMPEQPVEYMICRERSVTCRVYVDDVLVRERTTRHWNSVTHTMSLRVEGVTQ